MTKNVPVMVMSALLQKAENLISDLTVFDLASKCLPEESTEEPNVQYVYAQVEELMEKLRTETKTEVAIAMAISALVDLSFELANQMNEEDADGTKSLGNA